MGEGGKRVEFLRNLRCFITSLSRVLTDLPLIAYLRLQTYTIFLYERVGTKASSKEEAGVEPRHGSGLVDNLSRKGLLIYCIGMEPYNYLPFAASNPSFLLINVDIL